MPTVRFIREGIEVDVETGANLRKVASEAGVDVYGKPFSYGLNCKGNGHCGTCRVSINPETQAGASDLSLLEWCQFQTGVTLQNWGVFLLGFISFVAWFFVRNPWLMYGFVGLTVAGLLMVGASFAPLNFFDFIGQEDELRLSCQVAVEDDIEVYTRPSYNFYGDPQWQYDVKNPAIAGHASTSEAPPATPFEEEEMEDIEESDDS